MWQRSLRPVRSDMDPMIVEHARNVSEVFGGGAPVHVARPPDPGQPVARYVPAIDRARNELGLKVWISEAEAIRRTMNWLGRPTGSPCKRHLAPPESYHETLLNHERR